MYKPTHSLFLSLFIHTLLFGVLLFGYYYVTKTKEHQATKEKRLCINLKEIGVVQEKKRVIAKKLNSTDLQRSKIEKKVQKRKSLQNKRVTKNKVVKKLKTDKAHKRQEKLKRERKNRFIKEIKYNKQPSSPKNFLRSSKQEYKTPQKVSSKTIEQTTSAECCKSYKDSYLDSYLKDIITLLRENLYYPRRARKRGIEGIVTVSFTIDTDASLKEIIILDSKSDILSRAAKRTLEELSGVLPKPKEKIRVKLPIKYNLK
jgi:protein TonB